MKGLQLEKPSFATRDPYQGLSSGIIRQAAYDYRRLGKRLHKTSDPNKRRTVENEMKEISRFFLSDWFSCIGEYQDGGEILERLDKEVFGDD